MSEKSLGKLVYDGDCSGPLDLLRAVARFEDADWEEQSLESHERVSEAVRWLLERWDKFHDAREKAWDAYSQQSIEFTVSEAFDAGYSAGLNTRTSSTGTAAKPNLYGPLEREFGKVRKMVEDAVPKHHRASILGAGVVYAAMVAAMDEVLADSKNQPRLPESGEDLEASK